MFGVSKLLWALLAPDSLLVFGVLAALYAVLRRNWPWASGLLLVETLVLVALAIWPIGEWLLYPLEQPGTPTAELPAHVEGIVMLGGAEDGLQTAIWGAPELNAAAERLTATAMLARRYPEARVVLSGGSGSLRYTEFKDADIGRRFLVDQGLAPERLLLERESRNTLENILFTHQAVQPGAEERWILVTSSWHLPRALRVCAQVQWPVIPYAVDHRSVPGHLLRMEWNLAGHLDTLTLALREWVGWIVYGWLSERFQGDAGERQTRQP